MESQQIKSILASPEFGELMARRRVIASILTALMLAVYFGFILLLAFDKALLAKTIGEHLTIGIPVGIGVIVFAWVLTGIYVGWANGYYDAGVQRIKDKYAK